MNKQWYRVCSLVPVTEGLFRKHTNTIELYDEIVYASTKTEALSKYIYKNKYALKAEVIDIDEEIKKLDYPGTIFFFMTPKTIKEYCLDTGEFNGEI